MFRLSAEMYKLTLYNLFFFFITIILQDFFFLFEVSLYSGVGQTSGIY